MLLHITQMVSETTDVELVFPLYFESQDDHGDSTFTHVTHSNDPGDAAMMARRTDSWIARQRLANPQGWIVVESLSFGPCAFRFSRQRWGVHTSQAARWLNGSAQPSTAEDYAAAVKEAQAFLGA